MTALVISAHPSSVKTWKSVKTAPDNVAKSEKRNEKRLTAIMANTYNTTPYAATKAQKFGIKDKNVSIIRFNLEKRFIYFKARNNLKALKIISDEANSNEERAMIVKSKMFQRDLKKSLP